MRVNGALSAQIYRHEILQHHVLPLRKEGHVVVFLKTHSTHFMVIWCRVDSERISAVATTSATLSD